MKSTERSRSKNCPLAWVVLAGSLVGGLWGSQSGMALPQVGLGGGTGQDGATAPDNTGVNKQDRDGKAPTADKQKQNETDRDISRRIRQAIQKDKSMSAYGHNVKIIAQNGAVTLKGPVRSEDEKSEIEAIAERVAGQGNVNNELTVAPAKEK